MRVLLFFIFSITILACTERSSSAKILLPDVKSVVSRQLSDRDSSLILDSFYLVGIDTMTMQSGIVHQRYPYLRTFSRLNREFDSLHREVGLEKLPDRDALERLKTLQYELNYVRHVLDSLGKELLTADSVKPTGYRAVYKLTVRKPKSFTISDSIAYAISAKMQMEDWEGNVAKDIDSLALGRHTRSVNYKGRH
jgi:hypothetical protein